MQLHVGNGTDTDMKDERNWLLREALPELQDFALSVGAQLQLVDLRWGVSEEMTKDPEVGPVHLEQIRLCVQYSCGPNFVVSNCIIHLSPDTYTGFRNQDSNFHPVPVQSIPSPSLPFPYFPLPPFPVYSL